MTTRRPTLPPPRIAFWLFVAIAALAADRPGKAAPDSAKLVVVVYPGESDTAPGIILVNQALRSTFAAESPERVVLRNEYVDTGRLQDAEFMRAQVALLKQKYAGRKVDLVIAGLSAGLDFVLQHRDELFPGVPVVFVAVDQRELEARRLPADVVGMPLRMDLEGTLDLALRLHPDTRRVHVIAGSSPFDVEWETEARRTFRPYESRVEFDYLIGLPMDELLDRVANLPERSLVYFLHMHRDRTGKPFFSAEALDQIAARANAPIYGHVDTYVGRGIVGGRVFTFETEGTNAARVGQRILAGEKPETMTSLGTSANINLFDGRQLKRWRIDERNLPQGSIIQFKEVSFWDTYRWHVIGVATVVVLQTLLIAGLLIQRAKRRRAEAAERESEARFGRMADAAPILIWASGTDKGGTYFNRPWLEFTGRTLEQELGDGWTEGVHPDDRARCLTQCSAHFDSRQPFEMVFRLRFHNGDYRWVLDRGIPRFTANGEFAGYVGACVDVTARRMAEEELLANRQELQTLTGRLLEAQEAERRRVARELHDDINQSLALLSVEMELVTGSPPRTPQELTVRLRELSSRVKELSSSVHDLSHRLHPSKLEHLGLVVAIRDLCREMGHSHGLEVTFSHDPEPTQVPMGTALCLYRIVQEALRNVVRHSGGHHARVELTETADGVRLTVTDDGVGFDPAAVGGGLGMVSMRERLYLVGGQIAINSRPGRGTRIEVRVPRSAPSEPNGSASAAHDAAAESVAAGLYPHVAS
jgi:PAS domain S-box-containing protein